MKKQPAVKGRIVDGILQKTSKQAVKFWKYDGYGIKKADLHNVNGVLIDTQYDGKLYATVSILEEHGIAHLFGDEQQLILPVKFWRNVK